MSGHLGDNPCAQTQDGFSKQAFNIAAGILDLMEDTFNSLPDAAKPAIQPRSVLVMLIGASRCPNQIVGLIEDPGLPFQSQEAFVGEEIAEGK